MSVWLALHAHERGGLFCVMDLGSECGAVFMAGELTDVARKVAEGLTARMGIVPADNK